MEDVEDGGELGRIAGADELVQFDSAFDPIGRRAFGANRVHGDAVERRFGEIDGNDPAGA